MKNSRRSNQPRWCVAAAAILGLMLALPAGSVAAPGDPIGPEVQLPIHKLGVSVAVDCQGTVYYTGFDDSNAPPTTLVKMDKNGGLISQTPIANNGNQPVGIDEMSWDEGRRMLWGLEHRENPMKVWLIDPVTGLATFQFVAAQSNSLGIFRDGIALDGSDDTLWLSGDVSSTVEHYMTSGGFINQITPTDANGVPEGDISGVVAGAGDRLYLGHNPTSGATHIDLHQKNGTFISGFTTGGNRVEGLECDTLNFSPLLALWVRDFGPNPSHMNVFELEPGTCTCPGTVTGDDDDDNDDNDDIPFDCSRPIDALTMIWNGQAPNHNVAVKIVAHKGGLTAPVIATIDNIPVGGEVTVSGMGGTPNDQIWEIFLAGTMTKLGNSTFHISCSDNDMDGAEDCGKAEGNGKTTSTSWINEWTFEGMVDSDQVLDCTP
jgi:hypothetical protein